MRMISTLLVAGLVLVLAACPNPSGAGSPSPSLDYSSSSIGTLIYVPTGTFQHDATSTDLSKVSAFRLSRNLITRSQFAAIMGGDPSNGAVSSTVNSGANDPVQNVNWYMAIAFCNKLSLAEQLTPVYSVANGTSTVNFATLAYGNVPIATNASWDAASANWSANGYRLPTEMEYMWAAMGAYQDSIASDIVNGINRGGYLKGYSGSSEAAGGQAHIGDYEWYANNSVDHTTHPVGTKLPNELGLRDLTGNVWELLWDWYATPIPAGSLDDYRGPGSGTQRNQRGGSFQGDGSGGMLATRGMDFPYSKSQIHGFRVARN